MGEPLSWFQILCPPEGLLHAGDKLVEVNGYPVFGLEPEQIIKILVGILIPFSFKFFPVLCGKCKMGHDDSGLPPTGSLARNRYV